MKISRKNGLQENAESIENCAKKKAVKLKAKQELFSRQEKKGCQKERSAIAHSPIHVSLFPEAFVDFYPRTKGKKHHENSCELKIRYLFCWIVVVESRDRIICMYPSIRFLLLREMNIILSACASSPLSFFFSFFFFPFFFRMSQLDTIRFIIPDVARRRRSGFLSLSFLPFSMCKSREIVRTVMRRPSPTRQNGD